MKKLVVGILAHVDAGKTTLSEGMLYEAGRIRTLGRVDHKDAYLDTDPQERGRGITIFSKQAEFSYGDMDISLLDTPGHVDFSAEMERTLQVLDYAVLVISGTDGVQSHTETVWKLLAKYRIPVFIFVNKMDMPGANRERVLADVKARLSEDCAEAATEDFLERAAMTKEELLNNYLETGDVPRDAIADAIGSRKLFPCSFGSALKLSGVKEFLDVMDRYMQMPEYGGAFGARVFKIARDPKNERLTYLKVTGGALHVREQLPGHAEKVNQIRIYSGASYEVTEQVMAGDICAVTGLSDTYAGEGIGAEQERRVPGLEPVLSYRLIYPAEKDAVTVYRDMKQIEEEEPELQVAYVQETGEIFVKVMGEVQTQVLAAIVADRFGYEISYGEGRIVYKETITHPVMGVGHFEPLKHYAEVHVLMEPLPCGSGLVFETMCREDVLDKNWQRLILTHLAEKEHRGVLTGAPITDMKITLTAGRAHPKHTEGGDFRQATYRAVRQGLMMAESRLLEPIYAFRLELPAEQVGRTMTDITRMGGHVSPPEMIGDQTVLSGSCPVATMRGYMKDVAAYTKGAGRLSCVMKGYGPCSAEVQERVVAETGYDPDADIKNPAASVFCSHGAGTIIDWYDVYDDMHVREDAGFALAGMEAELAAVQEETEADTDNKSRIAHEKRKQMNAAYDEDELATIFERTYGSHEREGAYAGKNGWSGRADCPALTEKAETDNPGRTIADRILSQKKRRDGGDRLKTKPAEKGLGKPGAYNRRADEKEYLLVDGYNIIFAWEELRELATDNLDGARDRLADILSNYQGYTGCELILVFDAYKVRQNPGSVTKRGNIYVVYTKEAETADMYIEKTTHRLGRRYKVTVASSDGLEQLIIMGQGALRMSARNLREEIDRVSNSQKSDASL